MQLFIANTSSSYMDFKYRIPGSSDIFSLKIEPGAQAKRVDLEPHELRSVVKQLEAIGARNVENVSGEHDKVEIIYSDKNPINVNTLTNRFSDNQHALKRAGDSFWAEQNEIIKKGYGYGDLALSLKRETPADRGFIS